MSCSKRVKRKAQTSDRGVVVNNYGAQGSEVCNVAMNLFQQLVKTNQTKEIT